jgi:hypothetical protein
VVLLYILLTRAEKSHPVGRTERVPENRVLRRTFGLKGEEETGDWRKLNNEELHV